MIASNNNRIITFFFLTLALSILFLYFPQFLTLKFESPLAQLAPAIVALIFWNMYEEKDNFKTIMNKRIFSVSKPSLTTVFVAIIPIIIIPAALFMFQGDISFTPISFSFLFWAIIGAFSEELGWRGYIQYRFGLKNNILLSTVFTSFLWFGCQFNAILYLSVLYNVLLFVLILSFSIILSFLFYKSNRNMVLCFIFHAIHNILSGILISTLIAEIDFLFTLSMIYLIVAIAVVYFNRKIFQLDQW